MKKTNFVIVAHARSGSHMIDSLLNSHPNIQCDGGKFNKKNQTETDLLYPFYASAPIKPEIIVGFKLSYPLRDGKTNDIWSKIIKNRQFKVIHWYRSNLLRAYVSREIAKKTEKWMGRGEQPGLSDKKIIIDMNQCMRWINTLSNLHTFIQYEFRHHLCFNVSYENFLFDKNKAIEISTFLGVDSGFQLSTNLVKQNPEPLDQLIINYDEFATSFQTTKWATFLES